MNRARRLWRAVAPDPARERKLLEEFFQSLHILALLGINLRIGALQIRWPQHSWCSMTRARQKNHVEVILLDQPVHVHVDERQSRARSPMSKQTILDVLRVQRLRQQRILEQINHAQAEVV